MTLYILFGRVYEDYMISCKVGGEAYYSMYNCFWQLDYHFSILLIVRYHLTKDEILHLWLPIYARDMVVNHFVIGGCNVTNEESYSCFFIC